MNDTQTNETVNRPFASRLKKKDKKDYGEEVFKSAQQAIDTSVTNIAPEKTAETPKKEITAPADSSHGADVFKSAVEALDKENIGININQIIAERLGISGQPKKSSMVWDSDLYQVLTTLKRSKKIKGINEYTNEVVRKALKKDFPTILKENEEIMKLLRGK